MSTRASYLAACLVLSLVILPWGAAAQQPPPETPTGPSVAPGTVPPTASPAGNIPLMDSSGSPGAPQAAAEFRLPPALRPYLPFESPVPQPLGTLDPARSLFLGPVQPSAAVEAPPNFRLQTFVTLDQEFTDNAFQSKEGRVSEFQTTIAPGVALDWNRARSNLSFAYVPKFFIPSDQQRDSNAVNNDVTFRGALRPFDRVQFRLSEDFLQTNNFRSQQNVGSLATSGNTSQNVVNVAGDYILPQIQASLGYTNTYTTDQNDPGDNSLTNTGLASINFSNPVWSSIRGTYSVSRGDYWNASDNSYWEQVGTVSAAYILSSRINLIGDGGFTWHRTDNAIASDFVLGGAKVGAAIFLTSGASSIVSAPATPPPGSSADLAAPPVRALDSFLTAEAGAQYFSPRQGDSKSVPAVRVAYTQRFSYLSATASLEQGFESDFTGVAPTGLSEIRTAGLLFVGTAFRALTPSLGVRWYWQKFEQNTSFGAAGTRTATWEVEAKVAYLIARSFSLVLGYLMTDRTSSDHTNEFLENRVQLALTYNYDRW